MQTAFKEYKTGNSYYSLFMPNGISTTYWVASRCIGTHSIICYFYVSFVSSGDVSSRTMYDSSGGPNGNSHALFPVITLSSELIEGNASSGFSINQCRFWGQSQIYHFCPNQGQGNKFKIIQVVKCHILFHYLFLLDIFNI